MLDLQRLAELRNVLGEQRVHDLLRILERELAARIPEIARGARSGDLAMLRRQAHSLKGAAMSIGADGVGCAAATVERTDGAELLRAIAGLEQASQAALRAIARQTAALSKICASG